MKTVQFLKEKNISINSPHAVVVSDDNKIFTLANLLNEYGSVISKNYLCYSKIIDLIDESKDLKELEILVNRFFNENTCS